ncbi:MAG: DUF1987 domain-containing protein [Bacteroidales bacterium]|jgi:hypothetical protein|nr:DUF1987 domain-containing protein [Bacteroidales bacterium]
MESIRIEKTTKSPLFILEDGYIGIAGRSIPQNARKLYKACFDWVDTYSKQPLKETKVDLFFEYIDTSSIRCVVDILTSLDSIKSEDNQIVVNWYYEFQDDDLKELGTYIQAYLKIPFNFIMVEEGKNIM